MKEDILLFVIYIYINLSSKFTILFTFIVNKFHKKTKSSTDLYNQSVIAGFNQERHLNEIKMIITADVM